MQFSLSSLLWTTTLAAVIFALTQIGAQYFPDAYVLIALLSVPVAIIGFAMLVFAGFMAFSIWISPAEDFHRGENLLSCLRMSAAGFATTIPFLYFLTAFLIEATILTAFASREFVDTAKPNALPPTWFDTLAAYAVAMQLRLLFAIFGSLHCLKRDLELSACTAEATSHRADRNF